jgi:hypothetical protein
MTAQGKGNKGGKRGGKAAYIKQLKHMRIFRLQALASPGETPRATGRGKSSVPRPHHQGGERRGKRRRKRRLEEARELQPPLETRCFSA